MFASFIYTECQSPGPFKIEPGFKFKSVVLNELGGSSVKPTNQELEQALNVAASAFIPYKAPDIDPFMKPDQFAMLDKQWTYQRVAEGRYSFTRMFTSGVSNGRPDNPFHQGFILDATDAEKIVETTTSCTGLSFSRPVDFWTWRDWCNPRGDAELEKAAIEEDNPPVPALGQSEWVRSVEALFEKDIDKSMAILLGFERSLRNSQNFGINVESMEAFLGWVSLLTHLLPLRSSWGAQFTSTNAGESFPIRVMSNTIFKTTSESPSRQEETAWTRLVSLVIESGIHDSVDQRIGFLSKRLGFFGESTLENLVILPLACLFIKKGDIDAGDFEAISDEVATLLEELPFPKNWRDNDDVEAIFNELENSQTLLAGLPNSDLVYSKLNQL